MATSLKALCDKVLGESGFLVPTSYIGGINQDDVQMAYLANAAADDIREKAPQILRRQHSIALTTDTSYPLPSDFLSYVPDTAYTEGRLDPVYIPVDAATWANWLANNNPGGINVRARFLAGTFQVIEPNAGTVIRFEYVSSQPWTDASGDVSLEQATADTDLCLYDRRLMEQAIKWRWKKEKGLPDWQVDQTTWLQSLYAWMGRDQGARTLQFGEAMWPYDPAPQTNLWVT